MSKDGPEDDSVKGVAPLEGSAHKQNNTSIEAKIIDLRVGNKKKRVGGAKMETEEEKKGSYWKYKSFSGSRNFLRSQECTLRLP